MAAGTQVSLSSPQALNPRAFALAVVCTWKACYSSLILFQFLLKYQLLGEDSVFWVDTWGGEWGWGQMKGQFQQERLVLGGLSDVGETLTLTLVCFVFLLSGEGKQNKTKKPTNKNKKNPQEGRNSTCHTGTRKMTWDRDAF